MLTGPHSLTYAEIAQALSSAIQKSIAYEVLDLTEADKELVRRGFPEQLARDLVEIQRSFSNGAFTQVSEEVTTLLGRQARPFTEFARDHASAFC